MFVHIRKALNRLKPITTKPSTALERHYKLRDMPSGCWTIDIRCPRCKQANVIKKLAGWGIYPDVGHDDYCTRCGFIFSDLDINLLIHRRIDKL